MPEFRKDPVLDRWSIIAAERAHRPHSGRTRQAAMAEDGPCPFCRGNESMTPAPVLVSHGGGNQAASEWTVRVVPNKYPALSAAAEGAPESGGLYTAMEAAGVHEVVIESSSHLTDMASLDAVSTERVLLAYRERLAALRRQGRWRSALIYKNQGPEAGATLAHIHSQITALPMVPKAAKEELAGAREYFAREGRCVYCDIARHEIAEASRVVYESGRFLVFCAYAPRAAAEVWIVPKEHTSCFENGNDLYELAGSLRQALGRLSGAFDGPDFNYFIHTNPLDESENGYFHWHMEILPKLHATAGFEWGAGCFMIPLAPEEAARRLRRVAL